MARVVGLAGSAGLRGPEDGVSGAGEFFKTEQVDVVHARAEAWKQVGTDEVGDSTTWGDGNIDVRSEFLIPALEAAGGGVAKQQSGGGGGQRCCRCRQMHPHHAQEVQ